MVYVITIPHMLEVAGLMLAAKAMGIYESDGDDEGGYTCYTLCDLALGLACDWRLFALAFSRFAAYQRRERILALIGQRDTHKGGCHLRRILSRPLAHEPAVCLSNHGRGEDSQ